MKTLVEMLTWIGDKELRFQWLSSCMTEIRELKKTKSNKISFETDQLNPNMIAQDNGPVGMIVWIPRDKFEAAKQEMTKP